MSPTQIRNLSLLLLFSSVHQASTARAACDDANLEADANGDCVVNAFDSEAVESQFGCSVGESDPACDAADVNGDGVVDPLDVGYVLSRFCSVGNGYAVVIVDEPESPVDETTVLLKGTTVGATSVEVAGGAALATAPVEDCTFTVSVELKPNRVNHLFVTGIAADGTPGSPAPVSVTHDAQPPTLFIDFPADGAELTTETIDVAGRVGDVLSGALGISVNVNGIEAEVDIGMGTNGTFALTDLPLEYGANVITAEATDIVGNSKTVDITVTRVEIPADAPLMMVISGNGQSAPIHTLLPDPIVVHVVHPDGAPFVNKLVTFDVTRSNGRLTADGTGEGSLTLQVFTDSRGAAAAFWRLGSDAGCGNNRIEVTSTSIIGTTLFCASATPGPAAQINVGTGGSQRAEAGGPAAQPLRAWVSDRCNGVEGVPVTFTVFDGGGKVNGQSAVSVNTSETGHAEVELTLGLGGGNNVVEASFPGDRGRSARFVVYGVVRDESQPTSFSGLVVDNADQPIQGATCTLTVGGVTLPSIESGFDGQFHFEDLPASGVSDLSVDGSTAYHVGGPDGRDIPPGTYPFLHFEMIIVPNAENSLPMPVLLPLLNPNNEVAFDNTQDVELTVEGMDGLKMIVRAASMTLADGTVPDVENPATLSLNQVHRDNVPMPLPNGAAPEYAGTLQPGGATFDPPVELIWPNTSGLPSGSIVSFMSFNHDTGTFESVGTGSVTDDGLSVISDPGAGITVAGWHANCPPYAVGGSGGGGPTAPAPDNAPAPCDSSPSGAPSPEQCPTGGGSGCGDGDAPTPPPPLTPPLPLLPPTPTPPPDSAPPPVGPGLPGGDGDEDDERGRGETDPIYLFSGEFHYSVEDLRIRGRGLDFVWSRKYRSQHGPDTPQGNGWDFSYNVTLLEGEDDGIRLCDGNGREDTYTLQDDGTWARDEFYRVLEDNPDGTYTMTFGDTGTWTFHALDGSPVAGRVSAVTDRNGNTITLNYDGDGRLATITDTLNREIVVAYNAEGFIESVTDFAGRQVKYAYYQDGEEGGSLGDLKSVTSPAVTGTPTGNDFPNGKTTTYTYSTGFDDERLNHNLLTITDPKGQEFLRNSYSEVDDDTLLDFDRVVRQSWGHPNDITDIFYSRQIPVASNNFARVVAVLNDRVGNVREYYFDNLNRLVMQRRYTGRADADTPTTLMDNRPIAQLRPDDPPFFETRFEYNEDARRTKVIHPNGNITEYVYELDLDPNASRRARGNVREIHRLPGTHTPVGDQTEIVDLFEYDEDKGSCCGFNFVTMHTDGRGNVTMHDYDDNGNRIHTQHRIATIVEDWEHNEFGQVTAHTLPDNGSNHRRRDEFTYYDSGPQLGYMHQMIVDAGGFALTTAYEYDLVGNVIKTTDPRGHDTQFVVNQLDQTVRRISREVTDGSGIRYELDTYYNANDNIVRVDVQNKDETGTAQPNAHFTTVYEYEILNNVTRMCQEVGTYTDPIPGPAELPTCEGLPESEFITTEYEYDANRNRTLKRFGEAVEGRQPTNLIRTLYDERDFVFQVIRAEGDANQSTTQFDYDPSGNRIIVHQGIEDSPRVTSYTFDAYNRIVSRTDPMGNLATYTYDANSNTVGMRVDGELIDLEGSTKNVRLSETAFVFDAMDRVTSRQVEFFDTKTQAPIDDGQSVTVTEYNDYSQVTRVVDDTGDAATATYDTVNRVLSITDAIGNTRTNAYDANSNTVSQTEVDKSDLGGADETFITSFTYDNLDRLTQQVDNVGNTNQYAYDSRGNRVLTTDAKQNVVRDVFDGLNRNTQTVRELTDTGDGSGNSIGTITTSQAWDDTNRLTGKTDDNGNTTSYLYDALNRKIGEQYADGTVHSQTYDVHDNRITMTDANGSVTTCTYDLADRLTGKTIKRARGVLGTTFETFKYDGLSRMAHAEDDDSVVTRAYNSLSLVTAETLNGQTTTSVYDGDGNILSCMYPGGRTITCTYDALDRKKVISDGAGTIATYDYIGPSRVERRDYGNNTRTAYSYDGVRRIVGTTHTRDPNGTPIVFDDRTYTWDAMYNKTSRTDVLIDRTHEYTYDSIYRLTKTEITEAGSPIDTIDYALDGVGNRTTVTGGHDPGPYTLDPTLPEPADFQVNQYTTTPFDARTYDKNGNLVTSGVGNAIAYDYRNQMVLFIDSNTSTATTYAYDALGRRIEKTVDDGAPETTLYFYTDWQVCEEQDGTGITEATYAYGAQYVDEVVNMIRLGQTYYYHPDDLYNVMKVTDKGGAIVEGYEYGDYGEPLDPETLAPSIPSSLSPYLFVGRRYDIESTWYYYRTRYLDADMGRFTTRDIIGVWGDSGNCGNGYTYVTTNPTTLLDWLGERTWVCKKPLDALSGQGAWCNPDNRKSGPDNFPGNPFYHEYYCVAEDGEWPPTCFGQCSEGDKPIGDGRPCEDTFCGRRCMEWKSNECFEECLRDAGAGPRPQYCLVGGGESCINCQTWSRNTISECEQKCGVRDAPPQLPPGCGSLCQSEMP